MSVRYKGLLVIFLIFLIPISNFAQTTSLFSQNLSSIKIDNLSDDEIKTYLTKAAENGLSDQGLYNLLSDRGLPGVEIERLKERISSLKLDDKGISDNAGKKQLNGQETSARKFNKDLNVVQMQPEKTDLTIFGSELFTESSAVFEPNLRIATPGGYILGPDDELIINVFGYSEKTYNVIVNEEGSIYIPQIGPVIVNGLSIEQASSKIRTKFAATIYKAINSGKTTVQVTLGKIKSIRVTIIGEAKKPGTYTVSSLTTLFNLLYLCGGPSDMGSYRTIELIRGNVKQKNIDLYSFLLKGDQKDNVLLNEGDIIRIPYFTNRVTINGFVKHKGKFELLKGETFENILQYSGGFTDNAFKAAVTIYQLTDTERKIADLAKGQYSVYHPGSSDSIVVGKLLDRFSNKLSINGAIERPGDYELSNNLSLKGLIEKAGGVKEDAYPKRGGISRVKGNGNAIQLSFDIDSVMKSFTNIQLEKNDSVTIYSVIDINNPINLSIDGDVKKPGVYKWAKNITLRDMILTAGGLTEGGDENNIEIARRITNVSLKELNHLQTEIIIVNLSDSLQKGDIVLEPYDAINIRQKAGYAKQRTVIVEGMVINPGRYTLEMSGDRISEIVKRAGGFRANADTTALIIKRLSKKGQTLNDREKLFSKLLNIDSDSLNSKERIREEIYKDYDKISIDLNKALHDSKALENMLLEDGDIITIEQNTNLVKVSGEIYFPTIVPFVEGASLKYYVQKSGSYTELARRNGAMVIYPDGKAKKVKHFLFFKSYPEVVSRSEIYVPQKSDRNKSKISIGEWSVVLSSLAIIANVIINLRK